MFSGFVVYFGRKLWRSFIQKIGSSLVSRASNSSFDCSRWFFKFYTSKIEDFEATLIGMGEEKKKRLKFNFLPRVPSHLTMSSLLWIFIVKAILNGCKSKWGLALWPDLCNLFTVTPPYISDFKYFSNLFSTKEVNLRSFSQVKEDEIKI